LSGGQKPPPKVSIVIPAFNAEKTLGRALDCLQRQTCSAWEAIVVDDGSTDGTAALMRAASLRDHRVRSIAQANAGVSAARNAAISLAQAEWLVFLDADDYLSSDYLEKMLGTLSLDADAQVVCCGYARTNSQGGVLLTGVPDFEGNPFACFAHRSMGTIHSFMVRRSLVVEVGGFDSSLATCEDWDLYQRIFRTGAKLVQTSEILAFYESRPGSLSKSAASMVADAQTVFLRGCRPDPRVGKPHRCYANGASPSRSVDYTGLWIFCWCAAAAIGSGAEPEPIPEAIGKVFDVAFLGSAIFEGLILGTGQGPSALGDHWPRLSGCVDTLISGIAARNGNRGAGRAIFEELAWLIANAAPVSAHLTIGSVHVVRFYPSMIWRGLDTPPIADCVIIQHRLPDKLLHLPVQRRLLRRDIQAALIEWQCWRTYCRTLEIGRRMLSQVPAFGGDRGLPARAGRRVLRWLFRIARSADLSGKSPQGRYFAQIATEEARLAENVELPFVPTFSRPLQPYESAHFDDRVAYWEQLFETADPWDYSSPYEQLKYDRTLSLIPAGPIDRALELACAEGRFTALLAKRVNTLKAVDISQKALDRAKQRCAGMKNVEFVASDFFKNPIEGRWHLIVCSEVLYFLNDLSELTKVAEKIRDALELGGHVLMAHANLLSDDMGHTGFEWDHTFGSRAIASVLSRTKGLKHVGGISTSLYRIDLFRRAEPSSKKEGSFETIPLGPLPNVRAQKAIVWGGAIATRADCNRDLLTSNLPVLMYHRVTRGPDISTERFRINSERFEKQIRFLRRRGFRTVGIKEWTSTARQVSRFRGRPIMLTFDDATTDFRDIVWPILERNGFSACLFIVSGKVGGVADWEGADVPPAALMNWETLQYLDQQGIEFGSHMALHVSTDRMQTEEIIRSGTHSRRLLQRALNQPIDAVAVPYGVTSGRVRTLLRACGYTSLFTANYGIASLRDNVLDIPRIEISGGDSLEEFARKLQFPKELYPTVNDQ
jgi:peptidoglycan/xylan/chitin deacetylase (PgdA/CDA1 family)